MFRLNLTFGILPPSLIPYTQHTCTHTKTFKMILKYHFLITIIIREPTEMCTHLLIPRIVFLRHEDLNLTIKKIISYAQ